MRNIWLLTKTNIKRNKFGFLLSIFSGLLLCFLIYAIGGYATDAALSKQKIGVIDWDRSELSGNFQAYLKELGYELVLDESYDNLSSQLIDKEISIIIEIPEDLYEQISIGKSREIIITSTDDYENAAFIEAYMNSYLGSIRMLSAAAGDKREDFDRLLTDFGKETIQISRSAAAVPDRELLKEREGFLNSVGFYHMIVFGLGIILAFMILEDRLSGVFNRINISPVKPGQYVIGTGIFGFVLLVMEVLIYCGYITIMDIDIGFPIHVLVLLMTLFSLLITCFTIDMALCLKSRSALTAVIMGFSTIGAILGGAYFPLDLAPKSLQNLARILPQFWFMDTVRNLQADPAAIVYPNFIILSLYTLLAFLIGAVLFSQNYKKS